MHGLRLRRPPTRSGPLRLINNRIRRPLKLNNPCLDSDLFLIRTVRRLRLMGILARLLPQHSLPGNPRKSGKVINRSLGKRIRLANRRSNPNNHNKLNGRAIHRKPGMVNPHKRPGKININNGNKNVLALNQLINLPHKLNQPTIMEVVSTSSLPQ
jgi:hypothetical protein